MRRSEGCFRSPRAGVRDFPVPSPRLEREDQECLDTAPPWRRLWPILYNPETPPRPLPADPTSPRLAASDEFPRRHETLLARRRSPMSRRRLSFWVILVASIPSLAAAGEAP